MAEEKSQPKKTNTKAMSIAVFATAILSAVIINANQSSSNTDNNVSAQENNSQQATPAATPTITELVVDTEALSTLEAAVVEASLADTLKGDGPFTVFAPSDDAFAALLSDLGITADELLARDDLADVLTYHVVPTEALAADLSDGQRLATVQGEELLVSIEDGNVMINGVSVVTPDVRATNGVVHIVDGVLLPGGDQLQAAEITANGTIVDIAVDNGFNTLVSAVTEAGLADTLAGDGEFTVFAPTDEAFGNLLSALDVSADELLARDDLADILLFHVVSGRLLAEDVIAASGTNVDTLLAGSEWHVLVEDGNVFILNPTTAEKIAQVTATDIQATNGVVHVIDAVLIP